MKSQHTPGPWHVGVKQAEKIIYDATGWAVANATVYHGKEDADTVNANARLIAAAPDMLAALGGLAADLPELVDPDAPLQGSTAVEVLVNWWPAILAALAKAKG